MKQSVRHTVHSQIQNTKDRVKDLCPKKKSDQLNLKIMVGTEATKSPNAGQMTRWLKTALINISFIFLVSQFNDLYKWFHRAYVFQGFCDGMAGPTLLDMAELYSTSIDKVSIYLLIRGLCGVLGTIVGNSVTIQFM